MIWKRRRCESSCHLLVRYLESISSTVVYTPWCHGTENAWKPIVNVWSVMCTMCYRVHVYIKVRIKFLASSVRCIIFLKFLCTHVSIPDKLHHHVFVVLYCIVLYCIVLCWSYTKQPFIQNASIFIPIISLTFKAKNPLSGSLILNYSLPLRIAIACFKPLAKLLSKIILNSQHIW